MLDLNIINKTDSYKFSHYLQYPEGTEAVSGYIESRGGQFKKSVFYGLQIWLKNLKPINLQQVDRMAAKTKVHGVPFNKQGFIDLVNEYEGLLPIEIEAVAEGTILDTKNVLVQVVNTDPKYYWLPSYIETSLLRGVWYPTTVATLSYECKKLIWNSLLKSCDDPKNEIMFKLHDFGDRGVSSSESAGIGGSAHLVNFMGTDTFEALEYAEEYYSEYMAGFSIPAAEHSTMSAFGKDKEIDAYRNMLKHFAKPGSLVAVVSDTWDIYNAASKIWGVDLKNEVIKSGATVVIRPDSGNPLIVPVDIVKIISERFGFTVNKKGYKVLPRCVRVIQGDGITIHSIESILKNLLDAGFSAENMAFGMGGGLLQQVNRDTMQFAMKNSATKINGHWNDVYKDPITDKGKQSKRGRLALVNGWKTVRKENCPANMNLLVPVFKNGQILKTYTFTEIRERANREFI